MKRKINYSLLQFASLATIRELTGLWNDLRRQIFPDLNIIISGAMKNNLIPGLQPHNYLLCPVPAYSAGKLRVTLTS